MSRPVIECVPNFSEGRDRGVVDAIVEAASSARGAAVLDWTMDPDHHRSVLTLAGEPEAVLEAAVRSVGAAVERIDLTRHRGVHPRIGAADVVPFVPVSGVTLQDCAAVARRAGEEIWRRYQVPVYFYEAAALKPDRRRLELVRRGQFEELRHAVANDASRAPDIGGPLLHPTAGATAVGARKFLVAFNVDLETRDAAVARRIARRIRESSGGLPKVKAIGVYLASRGVAQVSMNLTDFEITPPGTVFDAIEEEARREGVAVASSEIIGLVPAAALSPAEARRMRVANFHPDMILERRLERALQ